MFLNKLIIFVGQCWLHIDGCRTDERITPFTEKSLKICEEKSLFRQQNSKRKSKFSHIRLPPVADGQVGYHGSCYRCFIAISTKSKGKLQSFQRQTIICVFHLDFG